MTQKQKEQLDRDMLNKWYEFVGREALADSGKNYKHLNQIIMDNAFIRKYVSCDKHQMEFWIFIMCDGEVGYFDGYSFNESFPQGLSKLLGIESYFGNEFELVNGSWKLVC